MKENKDKKKSSNETNNDINTDIILDNNININILIDYREKDLINIFNQSFNTISSPKILKYIKSNYKDKHNITNINISYDIINLDVGDINIKINDKLIYIIERKAVNDLISSIKTGRYQEQKIRIKSTKVNASYIIEGNINYINSNDTINGLKVTQLQGVFSSLLLKDNIPYLMTKNIQDTYDYLIYIIKKVLSLYYKKNNNINSDNNINNVNNNFNNNFNNEINLESQNIMDNNENDYIKTIKTRKKDNIDQRTCFIAQLMVIPGISHNIALEISKHYKSWFDLCITYIGIEEGERPNLLASILIDYGSSKRRLGKSLSSRIFKFTNGT